MDSTTLDWETHISFSTMILLVKISEAFPAILDQSQISHIATRRTRNQNSWAGSYCSAWVERRRWSNFKDKILLLERDVKKSTSPNWRAGSVRVNMRSWLRPSQSWGQNRSKQLSESIWIAVLEGDGIIELGCILQALQLYWVWFWNSPFWIPGRDLIGSGDEAFWWRYSLDAGMARSCSRLARQCAGPKRIKFKSLPLWILVSSSFSSSARTFLTALGFNSFLVVFFLVGGFLNTKFVLGGRAWHRGFYRPSRLLQFVDFSWSDWCFLFLNRYFSERLGSDRAK